MKPTKRLVKLIKSNNHEVIFKFQELFWNSKKIFQILLLLISAGILWYLTDTFIVLIAIISIFPILKKQQPEQSEHIRNLRITRRWIIFNRYSDYQYDDKQILHGQIELYIQAFSDKIELTLFEHKIVFENPADFTLFIDHFVKIADLEYDKTVQLNDGREKLIYQK